MIMVSVDMKFLGKYILKKTITNNKMNLSRSFKKGVC